MGCGWIVVGYPQLGGYCRTGTNGFGHVCYYNIPTVSILRVSIFEPYPDLLVPLFEP